MRTRMFSLLAFTLFASVAAHAADRLPMTLTPTPDVRAHIEKKGGRYNLIQPQGQRTSLATDDDMLDGGEPRFKQEDYNADGFTDLAVGIPAGPVDVSYALYLYDAKSTSYKPFTLPPAVSNKQNCEGFWNITLTPQRKAVRSECRGGARQHHDVLQFEPDGSVWISEQSRVPKSAVQWPTFTLPTRAVTFDRQGAILSETVLPYDAGGDEKATWVVPVKRLALYSAADALAATKGYLIKGDKTEMLAFEGDTWMKIAYVGKRGRIERWVLLEDAYGATKQSQVAQPER